MKKICSPAYVYVLLSFLCFFGLILAMLLSHGELWDNFFFRDFRDTGMDFFHSMEYVRGRTPYEEFGTLYPPLANLFFYVLYRMIPYSVSNSWEPDFLKSVEARGTNIDLRTYQAPMVLFIFFSICSVLAIYELTQIVLKDRNQCLKKLVAISVLMSYGVLYAVERGNIIVITWSFILMFLLMYDSSNKLVKELSLFCLAIAFGLKIYPALFGIIILKKKDFCAALRACLYGIFFFVCPVLFFKEGISGVVVFFDKMIHFGSPANDIVGNSFANILIHIQRFVARFGIDISFNRIVIWTVGIGLLLILAAFCEDNYWKIVMLIAMAITLLFPQEEYIYILYELPLIFALRTESRFEKSNAIELIFLMLVTIPIPLFTVWNTSFPRNSFVHVVTIVVIINIFISLIRNVNHMFNFLSNRS